ncbi:MAG TPA: dephospho-CoA kinase [Thermodesulfobacteriota bacterium]|nr:dephospho-CoA kinase [Thermodesulfobacteriota bacterium]
MLIVGLTGGYASGKSTVARMFMELGAALIDADQLAREVVEPEKAAWFEIVAHFGKGILLENRGIDRKALGEIVFKDKEERERLNAIVHPKVLEEELRAIEKIRGREPDAIVILSVPLLIESGHYRHCGKIIVVTVDEETHIKRLINRDGFTREEAIRRISAQMPLSEKVKYADFVIDNSGSIKDTESHVRNIFNIIKQKMWHH